jgi:hypothetical protein
LSSGVSRFRFFVPVKPDDFAKNQYKTEIKKRCFSDAVGEAPLFYALHGAKRSGSAEGDVLRRRREN